MSVYASLPAPHDDHAEGCGYWREDPVLRGRSLCDPADCTCRMAHAPIIYQGCHVLPSDEDERGGWIDLASIPGHITRDGRDDDPEDDDTPWPYLRFGVNGETVVLDRAGVELVHRSLAEWLERLA